MSNLLFLGFCFGSTSTAENAGDSEKLFALAIEGQLSEELVSKFYQYALKNAKEQIEAPEEFWGWLAKNKEIERGLLVGLHPDYNPHVIKHLQELRKKFGSQVEQYPHLALAFSFVYGAAKDKSMRPHWIRWAAKNRPVPSCSESFAYYIDNKDKMLYPLDKLPWPLMLYVADNDVPISERRWVLSRHAGRPIASFTRLHTEPAYIKSSSKTLPQILNDGGICYQQAYYAYGVLKSLGVPSFKVGGPGHVYEGWLVYDKKLKVKIGAAYGRINGSFFCPLTRSIHNEFKFKLLTSAIEFSYYRYLKSKIACHIFKMLSDASKKEALGLLEAAMKTNPYVVDSWLEYAQACEDGIFRLEAGWKLFNRAKGILSDFPELECILLNKLTATQLKIVPVISDEQYRLTRNNFNETLEMLRKKKHVDIALNALITHAKYLAKTKGVNAVIDNSLEWFKLERFKLMHQKILFKHIYNIALESKDEEILEKLLHSEYLRRTRALRKSSKKLRREYYFCYKQVADAYISYLKKTDDKTKMSAIYLELDKHTNGNFELPDFRDVVMRSLPLGAVEEQVTTIKSVTQGYMVWRILYDLPKSLKVRVCFQHPAVGQEGAFHLTAWSDKDCDGVPDTQIAISPLLTAEKKNEWSQWEFESTGSTVFVGLATETKIPLYYQMGRELKGYYGLSDRVFYSRAFDQTPESSVQPRYTNMRVQILRN